MTDDLVKRLREEGSVWKNFGDVRIPNFLAEAADRIEKLEAALYEIVHINNMRDRFSSEIDNVITTVMGEKK